MPSDHDTVIADLKTEVRSFCEARDWDRFHDPKDVGIGIATEASELLERFRFATADDEADQVTDPDARAAIEAELADVLISSSASRSGSTSTSRTPSARSWPRTSGGTPSTRRTAGPDPRSGRRARSSRGRTRCARRRWCSGGGARRPRRDPRVPASPLLAAARLHRHRPRRRALRQRLDHRASCR